MQQDRLSITQAVPSLEEALNALCGSQRELHALGVLHASIFGSVARGDATTDSDIDVLVELDPDAHVSLFDLSGIQRRLSEILGRKVDVVSKRGLRKGLDDSIVADAVIAF
jgi:predicted nucleotidyltransferase